MVEKTFNNDIGRRREEGTECVHKKRISSENKGKALSEKSSYRSTTEMPKTTNVKKRGGSVKDIEVVSGRRGQIFREVTNEKERPRGWRPGVGQVSPNGGANAAVVQNYSYLIFI